MVSLLHVADTRIVSLVLEALSLMLADETAGDVAVLFEEADGCDALADLQSHDSTQVCGGRIMSIMSIVIGIDNI
jgi:hypothetical protein